EDLVQQLAWVDALKTLNSAASNDDEGDGGRLRGLLPNPPPDDDLATWLALGTMFGKLHRELAADALDCHAVGDCGERLEGFTEVARWKTLAQVQEAYLRTLDELGLWDRQTARLFAIRQGECRSEMDVVLVGLVDMNNAQRRMLDQVGERVRALVFAPPEMADRFDEHGCLIPKAWLDAHIDLPSERIEVVDSPADQAAAVARSIAALDGRFCAEDISVGVPDVRLVPHIERRLRQCDVPSRYGVGRAVSLSPPFRFLADTAEYVSERRFDAFAKLVRHPHVGTWLRRRGISGDWLTAIDKFYEKHLPYRMGEYKENITEGNKGNEEDVKGEEGRKKVAAVYAAVEELMGVLDGPPRALGDWGAGVVELLVAVFSGGDLEGGARLDRANPADRQMLVACEKIHEVLRRNVDLPGRLAPNVSGSEAVGLVLREVENEAVSPLPERGTVEMLGWLELPWDDASAMIVTGMNEGIVPSSLNADLFLPNKLRRALGIEDNDRRYARDAYTLALLAASREELRVIAGRRTGDGDPLSPTRLFFATDDVTIARRAVEYFGDGPEDADGKRSSRVELPGAFRPGSTYSRFEVPAPRPLAEPVRSMRVTEFRDYLACPYRYYLRHCLKLEAVADTAVELDGGAFGSLAHEVLQYFGKSELIESSNAETIAAWLGQTLDRLARRFYGTNPLSAVRVQVEQLRRRLEAFSRWQAGWAAEGWRIEDVEFSPEKDTASLTVDGEPMFLRGRIDRIDVNRRTGKMALFDYKTSDTSKKPAQAHQRKGEWIDLQLPLYRHLVAEMDFDGSEEGGLQLGYIVLPKDTSKTGRLMADWGQSDLQDADATAAEVVRAVRSEKFPLELKSPAFSEDFAAICQDKRIGRPLLEDGLRFATSINTEGEAP
ncbi:MAG: PD-(D/E)XK nuclease family protein, partial [Planctomycetota bacterium]|nr:PD-(D/E)XK nuclease family protein [Planctomycetota bacterium]